MNKFILLVLGIVVFGAVVFSGCLDKVTNENSEVQNLPTIIVGDYKFITEFGEHCVKDRPNQWNLFCKGGFNLPLKIAIDSLDNIYVVDQDNRWIQKFDSDGNYLLTIGENIIGLSEYSNVKDIAIDFSSNLYIIDGDAIKKFSSDGSFIKEWSTGLSLSAIAFDPIGKIHAVGNGANAIYYHKKYDLNGVLLDDKSCKTSDAFVGSTVSDFEIDNAGNIYAVYFDSDELKKLSSDCDSTIFDKNDINLDRPQGLTLDSQGNIYVADSGNHKIQIFDGEGNFVSSFGKKSERSALDPELGAFIEVADLAFDSLGNVYVLDKSWRILKFKKI